MSRLNNKCELCGNAFHSCHSCGYPESDSVTCQDCGVVPNDKIDRYRGYIFKRNVQTLADGGNQIAIDALKEASREAIIASEAAAALAWKKESDRLCGYGDPLEIEDVEE